MASLTYIALIARPRNCCRKSSMLLHWPWN